MKTPHAKLDFLRKSSSPHLTYDELVSITDEICPLYQLEGMQEIGIKQHSFTDDGALLVNCRYYNKILAENSAALCAWEAKSGGTRKAYHYTKQPAFLAKQELLAPQKLVRVRAKSAMRRSTRLQRTPAWADGEAIKALYDLALRKEQETGIPHQVDHIVPLRGKFVSGLHVEYNLQILTEFENNSKGNRFEVNA